MAKKLHYVCAMACLAMLLSACAKTPAKIAAVPIRADEWGYKGAQAQECMPPEIKAQLDAVWKDQYPQLKRRLKKGAKDGVPTAFYNAQGYTNNLLNAAALCGDIKTLSELAEFIVIPFSHLKRVGGVYTWADKSGTVVNTLSLSQYLYLVSRALNIVSSIPKNQRTAAMNRLIAKAPKITYQHYNRWIFGDPTFSVTAWGCHGSDQLGVKKKGRYYFTHSQFVELKLEKKLKKKRSEPTYCNAVDDTDLWIATGLVELLAARRNIPDIITITGGEGEAITGYLATVIQLTESRISKTRLRDFNGKRRGGIVFDRGAWSEHPENAYSGYTGDSYPTEKDKKAYKKVTWDVSHARRFVHVFGTLFHNRDITGQQFPDEETMRRLANQYAYGAFNEDLSLPLFTNYFDGHNGWYRVGYAKRKGFGYGPYKLSNAGMTGGYGFWKSFNPDIESINEALLSMMNSEDPEVKKHLVLYYYSGSGKGYALLNFLPVFAKTTP